jgi:hypothetical protein
MEKIDRRPFSPLQLLVLTQDSSEAVDMGFESDDWGGLLEQSTLRPLSGQCVPLINRVNGIWAPLLRWTSKPAPLNHPSESLQNIVVAGVSTLSGLSNMSTDSNGPLDHAHDRKD